jgi:Flp pilus assembly protein TadG
MRGVRRFSLVRVRDEEHGAVVAIVAISLICLLGMLVLTFDLGRGVALKRNMVNAADSGALAAARECGLAKGTDSAQTAAQQLVADNNSAATVASIDFDDEAQCNGAGGSGKRQVTVVASVPQEYFFAQIFGFTSGTVTASATAEWTTGVTNPAPIKLDALKVEECLQGDIGTDDVIDCYFTFEKLTKPGTSQWGWLNLPEGWPIKDQDTNPKNCSAQTGGSKDLVGYVGGMGGIGITGDTAFLPGLWDPTGAGNPPTWVCAASGHQADSVEAINEWVANVTQLLAQGKLESEPTVQFPIVACDPARTPGDPDCREWKYAPGLAYPVVRLQGFWVKEAWDGQQARRQPNCHFTRRSSDVFCLHLQTSQSEVPPPGGSVKVWLVD